MNCEIVRSPPIVWVCVFATVIAISSLSITFEDSFAQTITIDSVSEITDAGTLELDGARGITSFKIGSSTYLAVASVTDDGVQILDVSTPSTITQVSEITDGGSLELDGAFGITSFKIGSSTYLAVASNVDHGVQILDVSTPGTITQVSEITDAGTLELEGAIESTSFKIGSSTYLAVASVTDDGVQILDVSTPSTITQVSEITDGGSLELDGAFGITSFKIGSSTYLAVASNVDHGVQILDVSTPGTITQVSEITDAGTLELEGAIESTSFKIGSSTYLAVASVTDDGVQILDVSTPSTITQVSEITDGGSLELDGAFGITSFKIGSSTYLAVASNVDHGVQILDVSTPGTITQVSEITDAGTLELEGAIESTSFKIGSSTYLAVASVTDDGVQILDVSTPSTITQVSEITDTGTLELEGARGITSFKIGTSTYLAVASFDDDGVQILKLNQPPIANAGRDITGYFGKTITLDGSSSTDPDGDTLGYTWQQNTADTIIVELTDAGLGRVTFTAPDEPATLEFTLTVLDNSLQDTDTITITITKPIARNIKEMGDTLMSAKITAPNQITMIYNEELSTFINSYLNFTISDEDKPRNITGINGSPAIETGETVHINGKQVKTYSTTLTFDGEPVPADSTGSMYIQHADHYLALIQVSDGQD